MLLARYGAFHEKLPLPSKTIRGSEMDIEFSLTHVFLSRHELNEHKATTDGAQTAPTTDPQQSHKPLGGRDNRSLAVLYRARRGRHVVVSLRLVLLSGDTTVA